MRTVLGIPLSGVVAAQVSFVIGALAATVFGLQWPIALAVGGLLALPWLLRFRRSQLTSTVRTAFSYLATRRGLREWPEVPPAFDVTGPDGDRIGLRWDGEVLTSVIRLLPMRGEFTSMRHGAAYTRDMVPMRVLAESLDQFDIALEGIDVVSLGARSAGGTLQSTIYERLLGPLPAIARRNTWLTVRFDPRRCADAVARRGGDTTGALKAAAIATTRIVRRLAEAGHGAKVLPAVDVNKMISQLTGGVAVEQFRQHWSTAQSPREYQTSFVVQRQSLAGDGLAPLWAPTARNTTVTVQIRPGSRPGAASVGALVRYATPSPDAVPAPVGAARSRGRQFESLLASLPFGARGQAPLAETAELDGEALDALAVPASGCGQLLGADPKGDAIAARIAAPDVRHVEVVGGLFLTQQVVLRAIAIGARVLVHTGRAPAWQPMVDAINLPRALSIAAASAGATSHASNERDFNVVVVDGTQASPSRADITVIRVVADPMDAAPAQQDIRLVQHDAHRDAFELHVSGRVIPLSMVTIPDELRIIGDAQPGRRLVGAR